MSKLLLVEDDQSIVSSLSDYLGNEGFKIESASGQKEAIEVRSQGGSSRASVQQEIICCSNRIKMVQKPRKIKVFRGFTISKRADIV